jgi:hypothetical protein
MKTTSIRRASISFFAALFVLSFSAAQAQTPVIHTYTPDPPHAGYFAPEIDLCTVQNPCSSVTTIQFDIYYDEVFDLADYQLHGLWFSPDGQASVDIDNYPEDQRVHVTLTRDFGVTGGGTVMRIPGIGIVEEINAKRADLAQAPAQTSFTVQAYPNPATEACHFRINQPARSATLVDLQGRTVWKTVDLAAGEHSIPVENLPSGIYALEVRKADVSHTIKIMVAPH